MKSIIKKISGIFLLLSVIGCLHQSESNNKESPSRAEFQFNHKVGSESLVFDQLAYKNGQGTEYSITKLQYYISDVKLKDDLGDVITSSDKIAFMDAKDPQSLFYLLNEIPAIHYHTINFTFGLTQSQNKDPSLLVPEGNSQMKWPSELGGGYFFMKLEGQFKDSLGVLRNFKVYIGNDTTNVENNFVFRASGIHYSLSPGNRLIIPIEVNINNWFQNPNSLKFYTFQDESATMGNPEVQIWLNENGKNDLFAMGEVNVDSSKQYDFQ